VIVVVLGSLMGEETKDEEIKTTALNTYTTLWLGWRDNLSGRSYRVGLF
jgi:hypothetical protein